MSNIYFISRILPSSIAKSAHIRNIWHIWKMSRLLQFVAAAVYCQLISTQPSIADREVCGVPHPFALSFSQNCLWLFSYYRRPGSIFSRFGTCSPLTYTIYLISSILTYHKGMLRVLLTKL